MIRSPAYGRNVSFGGVYFYILLLHKRLVRLKYIVRMVLEDSGTTESARTCPSHGFSSLPRILVVFRGMLSYAIPVL